MSDFTEWRDLKERKERLSKEALEDDRRERQRLKKTLEASNRWDDCDDDWGNIGFYRNDYD